MKEKVLILEANTSSGIFLVQAAKKQGLEVHVATHQDLFETTYPEVLRSLIDYPVWVDFKDEAQCLESLSAYSQAVGIRAVVAGFEFVSDLAIKLARQLGLPTHDLADTRAIRDKYLMNQLLTKRQVPVAKTFKAASFEEAYRLLETVSMPCVVKPLSNAGSCGVFKISEPSELQRAVENIQAMTTEFPHGIALSTAIVIQEFLEGQEYSVEILSSEGEVAVIGITEKFIAHDHFGEVGYIFPAVLSQEATRELVDVAKRAAIALGLTNGIAHVEVKATPQGTKVIEVGARLAGDHIPELVYEATGVNCASLYLAVALGELPTILRKKQDYAGIWFLRSAKTGIFKGLKQRLPLDDATKLVIDYEVNQEVVVTTDNTGRLGYLMIVKDSYEAVIEARNQASKQVQVRLETRMGEVRDENCLY